MELNPITPFEPIATDIIPRGDKWIAQVKWDGVRMLTYWDEDNVRLFNRRKRERTLQYPEFVNIHRFCMASSVILDGEIIALDEGKPSFRKVMKRDGIRIRENVEKAKKQVPVTYMVFDVLFYNSAWITSLPLSQRQQILTDIIIPQEDVQIVESFTNMKALFDVIRAEDMEGIVCKQISSPYWPGRKDSLWQKVKNYRDLIALIGGVTFRGNTVNAVLLGLYDEQNRFWYIGHAGTGKLSSDDWKILTCNIMQIATDKIPFFNKPERCKEALWTQPLIAVKIKYIEWPKGHTLRQPSIQAFVDISPNECNFEKQL